MKTDWPKVIRSGSVTVKIYQVPNNGYPQHVISYYLGTRRVRKVITEFAEAKEEAERIAKRLSRGDQEALKLTGTDTLLWRSYWSLRREGLSPTTWESNRAGRTDAF